MQNSEKTFIIAATVIGIATIATSVYALIWERNQKKEMEAYCRDRLEKDKAIWKKHFSSNN